MPLILEAIEGGIITTSEVTRKFFLDYSTALFTGDFTPIEDRPGAAEAIAEMRSIFEQGLTCQQFKDFLYNLGMFGCGRSRRLKAIGAVLGLKDTEIEDCLKEPKADGTEPRVYYLPPDDAPYIPAGAGEPAAGEHGFCPIPGDTEDVDDLEDPSDCQTAEDILQGISDLFPVLPEGSLSDKENAGEDIIEASTRGEQAKQDAQTILKETGETIAGSFADYWAASPLEGILAEIKTEPPVAAPITSDDVIFPYDSPEDAALDPAGTDTEREESDPYDTIGVEQAIDEIKSLMQGFGTSINQLDDLAQIVDLAGRGIQAAAILGHPDMIEEFKTIIRQAEEAELPLREAEIAARHIDNHWDDEPNVEEVKPRLTEAFPLYTPRSYLDALYTAINIHDLEAMQDCKGVQNRSEELIETINNVIDTLPVGYINPDLLPPRGDAPDSTVKQRPKFSYAGLSDGAASAAKRSAASNRRYRANQMEA